MDGISVEPTARIGVTVTFLRMSRRPNAPPAAMPSGTSVVRVPRPSLGFYRYLYNTVGESYVWWLRRIMPDGDLRQMLADPKVELHVLYRDGEPAGFAELDSRMLPDVNISYFGLLPHAVGQGVGLPFLQFAVAEAWRQATRSVLVNTCTADHPRALPNYLRVGFEPLRRVREVWEVPLRLGLAIPDHLRI